MRWKLPTAALLACVALGLAQSALFEVVSIKPTDPANPVISAMRTPPGELAATATLASLIKYAYDLQDFQVIGGSKWLREDRFDIDAKASHSFSPAEAKVGMRDLLHDRFGLRFAQGTREFPLYRLVVAKGGVKMKPADAEALRHGSSSGPGMLNGPFTATVLATRLGESLGKPVIDATGLAGAYVVAIKWDPTLSADPGLGAIPAASLFTVLQDELGLKLEVTKGPMPVLIITAAGRPTAN